MMDAADVSQRKAASGRKPYAATGYYGVCSDAASIFAEKGPVISVWIPIRII